MCITNKWKNILEDEAFYYQQHNKVQNNSDMKALDILKLFIFTKVAAFLNCIAAVSAVH